MSAETFYVTISLNITADNEWEAEDKADEIINMLFTKSLIEDGFVADVEEA